MLLPREGSIAGEKFYLGLKTNLELKIMAATKIQLGGYVTILLLLQVHHMMLLQ
jgi:hypothetical protein